MKYVILTVYDTDFPRDPSYAPFEVTDWPRIDSPLRKIGHKTWATENQARCAAHTAARERTEPRVDWR